VKTLSGKVIAKPPGGKRGQVSTFDITLFIPGPSSKMNQG